MPDALRYAREITAYAEVGIGIGETAVEVIRQMPAGGLVHVFDFEDVVRAALPMLQAVATPRGIRVVGFGNSRHDRASYCWTLMKLMRERGREPLYDYVYLDGAHMWDIDGFAFCLLDLLLKPGGRIELDDWGWTAHTSPTVGSHADWRRWYPAEQLQTPNVNLIVDLLVRPRSDYVELTRNRLFRKKA